MHKENYSSKYIYEVSEAEYVPASYRTPILTMFHDYHGQNIVLSENNTAAYRMKGYAHGITFSREPLLPGEIFLLEIVKFEHGWMGNIRCGLTQKNPSSNFDLPPYALPGLVHEGHSWILPITRADLNIFPQISINDLSPAIYESNDHIYTSRGCLPSSTLWPSCQKLPTFAHSDGEETVFCSVAQESLNHTNSDNGLHIIPGGIGNRIGVTYIIRDSLAEMYIFFNGSVYGPCATEIPLNGDPIYAVVDLYGTTKKVRIVQIYAVPSLQIACRDKVRQLVSCSRVFHLPLPQKLKDFIYYSS